MIRGKVLFKGVPPTNPRLPIGGNPECAALHPGSVTDPVVLVKDGRLQNVFVFVKTGLESYVFDWPRVPVTMSNEKCLYTPRVIGVQVHQPVRFENQDAVDHNVLIHAVQGLSNRTLHGLGSSDTVKFLQPEVMIPVTCSLHPWMVGYIGVVRHPFFQVTGPDGSFEFKGLPPGEYEIEAWHETQGRQTRKAKLDPKGSLEIEFDFPDK
jgi:plastocyanin